MSFFKKLSANKRGATAIEYAIIAGLIAVVAVGAFQGIGAKVNGKFLATSTALGE